MGRWGGGGGGGGGERGGGGRGEVPFLFTPPPPPREQLQPIAAPQIIFRAKRPKSGGHVDKLLKQSSGWKDRFPNKAHGFCGRKEP